MSKIKVSSIEITPADGKPVKLTLNEARDLYNQLDALFGQRDFSPIIIERDRYPQPWSPYGPFWYTTGDSPQWPGNTIVCGGSANSMRVAYSGETIEE